MFSHHVFPLFYIRFLCSQSRLSPKKPRFFSRFPPKRKKQDSLKVSTFFVHVRSKRSPFPQSFVTSPLKNSRLSRVEVERVSREIYWSRQKTHLACFLFLLERQKLENASAPILGGHCLFPNDRQVLFSKRTLFDLLKLREFSGCPSSHPYTYLNGDYCCSQSSEENRPDIGDIPLCDGGPLKFDSRCCKGDDYLPCPDGNCITREDTGEISQLKSEITFACRTHITNSPLIYPKWYKKNIIRKTILCTFKACSSNFPYAYLDGQFCCASQKDCGGHVLKRSSRCCEDKNGSRCPDKGTGCRSILRSLCYVDGNLVRHIIFTKKFYNFVLCTYFWLSTRPFEDNLCWAKKQ